MGSWEEMVPDPEWIWDHIERIVERGIRRPGTEADRLTEDHVERVLRELGLEHIRREPVTLRAWQDHAVHLRIGDTGIAGFAVPYSEPTTVEAPLARWDPARPGPVAGCIAVHDVRLMAMPASFPAWARAATGIPAPGDGGWAFDPHGTFNGEAHLLPFAAEMQGVMDGAIAAGAVGYIGVHRLPGGGCRYYVPYDGEDRPVPGIYVDGTDAATEATLDAAVTAGATARLTVEAERSTVTNHNIVGELPGADDEWVLVASHHDGPWASAVEDASGVALVLAQARLWAAVPEAQRPHRLVFGANAGHMCDGAGTQAFIAEHRDHLDDLVLEIHLEHAAMLGAEVSPDAPDRPVPAWWFTSEEPRLEQAVWDALTTEGLERSLLLAPTAFGVRPTTDGGFFHDVGVPLVNYLTAPWYLFDPRDDLDKVHRPSLTAVTRATARIIEASAAWSASDLRAGVRPPSP